MASSSGKAESSGPAVDVIKDLQQQAWRLSRVPCSSDALQAEDGSAEEAKGGHNQPPDVID